MPVPGSEARSLLVVCTGNICRSPAAEVLLRAGLGEGADVRTGSAGLAARVGEPVAEPMARLLRARGLAPDVVARQLDAGLVREADVVLTMTADQRAAVVARVPAAVRRTFTLREFAGLAGLADLPDAGGPAGRLAALVPLVPRLRARRGSRPGDDIDDPYGRPQEAYARALAGIEHAVGDLLDVVLRPRAHAV